MESHASVIAIFRVPPFLSEGLTTFSRAVLNPSPDEADPPPVLCPPPPPPQAETPSVRAARAAVTAGLASRFFISRTTPCPGEPGTVEIIGTTWGRARRAARHRRG